MHDPQSEKSRFFDGEHKNRLFPPQGIVFMPFLPVIRIALVYKLASAPTLLNFSHLLTVRSKSDGRVETAISRPCPLWKQMKPQTIVLVVLNVFSEESPTDVSARQSQG